MFDIQNLYSLALAQAGQIVHDRIILGAWLLAIAALLVVGFGSRLLGWRRNIGNIVVAIVIGFVVFWLWSKDLPIQMDTIGRQLANQAVTSGVDSAQKSQATELQYIHAVVKKYGIDTINCRQTVNFHDECSSQSNYYTHREINSHPVCSTSTTTDPDGNTHTTTSCHEEHDDQYTPWFTHLVKYWIVPDTQTRFLHPSVYQMQGEPKGNPKVWLTPDWRAPEEPTANFLLFERPSPSQYNAHIPEFWYRVRRQAQIGGAVVVANFVGPYFNWGAASGDSQFLIYDGEYQQLKQLINLPGPTGVSIQYTNAFNKTATMKTLLAGESGELALDYQPITTIGVTLNPELMEEVNKRAVEFQGHAGPNKQASIHWFFVSDSIVRQLGGMPATTAALKAYLNDGSVWGLFQLPKNELIIVESISDDGSKITGRDLTTGMPFGNVLVAQDMRLSIPTGTTLPVSADTLIGKFTDSYTSNVEGDASYTYSNLIDAGGPAGVIYQETPGYVKPDPADPNCVNADPEHHGFILYRMCSLQYLQTSIKVSPEGEALIMDQVKAGAENATPLWVPGILFVVGLVLAGLEVYVLYQESQGSNSYRRYTYR